MIRAFDDDQSGTVADKGLPVVVLRPELLSRQASARCLGVSLSTLDRLIADGLLPSVRVGERRMVRPKDLRKYVNGLEVAPSGKHAEQPLQLVNERRRA